MKKLYKVTATYTSSCHIEVLADDSEQAMDIARDIDGGTFTPDDNLFDSDWNIAKAEEIHKTITISGSYGEFEVDATTGKILHRDIDEEYAMIEKFNMPETLANVGDTLEDITGDYGLDIILCGYTYFDGTVEAPIPPEEKLAIRERAICGIDYDKNKNNYRGMTFVKSHCMTSDDGNHMDTFHMPEDNIFIQITADKITAFNSDKFEEVGAIELKEKLMFSAEVAFMFVSGLRSENTGGNCMVDVLLLPDGRYIGVTDEVICLYPKVELKEGEKDLTWSEDYLYEHEDYISLL